VSEQVSSVSSADSESEHPLNEEQGEVGHWNWKYGALIHCQHHPFPEASSVGQAGRCGSNFSNDPKRQYHTFISNSMKFLQESNNTTAYESSKVI